MTYRRRVAVVADAVSDNFYFPLWHKFYSQQCGAENLYIVCFDGDAAPSFSRWRLGGIEYKIGFNNNERAMYISDLVSALIKVYDYVIRVDIDEFVVPDPRKFGSLRDYVDSMSAPYVTTMGYNVLQGPEEAKLDLGSEILITQRRFAHAYNSLYKTCIVNSPTTWLPGFHVCTHPPALGDLFLFHLKVADLDMQIEIGRSVAGVADEVKFREYHSTPRDVFAERNRQFFVREKLSGFSNFVRDDYNEKFLSEVHEIKGIFWTGSFTPDRTLLEIPDQFRGTL